MNKLLTLAAAAAATALPTFAQDQLVGFGAASSGQTSILGQTLCNAAQTECNNALPAPAGGFAGGLAFDPVRDSVFHTQGTRLLEIRRNNCTVGCAQAAQRLLGNNSLVGGLEMDPGNRVLWQVESFPGVGALSSYRVSPRLGACPQPQRGCRFALPTNDHRTGALALIRSANLLLVGVSRFTPGQTPDNQLFVFPVVRGVASCTPICRVRVPACNGSLQGIRAMAYDDLTRTLYVSDGRQTSRHPVRVSAAGCIALGTSNNCCPTNAAGGELYHGFDVLPRGMRILGTGCPGYTLSYDVAPQIGVTTVFQFDNAPVPFEARFYAISTQGAQPQAIGLCERLFPVNPFWFGPTLGPLAVPVPNVSSLVGVPLCVQGLGLPPAGPRLTNALSGVVGG